MNRSKLAAIGGIGLLASAALLRFVVVPSQAQLPADTDTIRTYEGTLKTLLDAEALAALDLANVLIRDVPIAIERHVAVEEVGDGLALVAEQTTVVAPDGTPILASDVDYAVNRATMEATTTFGEATVAPAQGLVIGWPIDTEARDYEGWSGDLLGTVTAAYAGEEEHAGIDTYVFEARVDNARIVNPVITDQLPAALPKAQIGTFASILGLDEAVLAGLEPVLAQLPDEVPLGYVYSVATRYWVDPVTGIVIDLDKSETRSVVLDVPGLDTVPVAAVYDVTFAASEASVVEAVADARDAGGMLTLFGSTLPTVLVVGGSALLVLALWLRREDDDAPTGVSESPRVLVDAS